MFRSGDGGVAGVGQIDRITDFRAAGAGADLFDFGVAGVAGNFAALNGVGTAVATLDFGKTVDFSEILGAANTALDQTVRFVAIANGSTDAAGDNGTAVAAVANTLTYVFVDYDLNGTADHVVELTGYIGAVSAGMFIA